MRIGAFSGRIVAIALGVAGIAGVRPDPVHPQERSTEGSPPFLGSWWEVDRPVWVTGVMSFEEDGTFLQREGHLEANSYRVVGDSLRLAGASETYVSLRPDSDRPVGFRIRGDTLRYGRDDMDMIRVGAPSAPDARLVGRWRYERHGGTFELEFTADGRVIRWIVRTGTWTSRGDSTVVVRHSGPPITSAWRIREDLLTLTDASGLDRGTRRLLRVTGSADLTFRSALTTTPRMMNCGLLRATAERFVEERRGAVFDADVGPWGFYDYEDDALRISSAVLQGTPGWAAHVMAHLAAHALGFGTVPDEEWIAEEVARQCTG